MSIEGLHSIIQWVEVDDGFGHNWARKGELSDSIRDLGNRMGVVSVVMVTVTEVVLRVVDGKLSSIQCRMAYH